MIGFGVLAAVVVALQAAQVPLPANARPDPADRDQATVEAEVRLSVTGDLVPRRDAAELRPRAGLELTAAPRDWLTVRFDGMVEALVADRNGRVTVARGEVRDLWVEARGSAGDLRAGYGRLVWGRLDEIAPTDVINPLDASRFLTEGRSEARLPVPFVRGRLLAGDRWAFEGVVVPGFRRGLFDRLGDDSSPFNLLTDAAAALQPPIDAAERAQLEPPLTWSNLSGGARAQVTVARVDLAGAIYRGFDGIGPVVLEPAAAPGVGRLVEYHPRFTMIGADAETIAGEWAVRGEMAGFVERTFAGRSRPGLVPGRSIDAGIGADRRAGSFRVFTSAVLHREWSSEDPLIARTDVNLVGSVERTFDRERYLARGFAVVNPRAGSAFLRGMLTWQASDRVAIDGSLGLFLGTSEDTIGRFGTRDFLTARVRTWF